MLQPKVFFRELDDLLHEIDVGKGDAEWFAWLIQEIVARFERPHEGVVEQGAVGVKRLVVGAIGKEQEEAALEATVVVSDAAAAPATETSHEEEAAEPEERGPTLNTQRLATVLAALRAASAKSVIDLDSRSSL